MQRTTPPFRADHVGSLLRPAALKEARAKHERKGEITAERCAKSKIARSKRRSKSRKRSGSSSRPTANFAAPGGSSISSRPRRRRASTRPAASSFTACRPKAESVRVIGKIGLFRRIRIWSDFKFVKDHTRVTPKMTIPAPGVLHFRQGRALDQQAGLSRSRAVLRGPRQRLSQARSAHSTMPAAATCSSTTPPGR
jgi:5-methyltetrahydropteroyltriglutamate--homocysteine methyltransferase